MNSIINLLPEDVFKKVEELITEHRGYSWLNYFLYKYEECKAAYEAILKEKAGDNVSLHTWRSGQIEMELIPIVHEYFHGLKVKVQTEGIGARGIIEGVVEHEVKRTYKDSQGKDQITDHIVSFRAYTPGKPHHDDWEKGETYAKGETIALWVNTGDRYTTHLYNIDKIFIIE